MARTYKAGKGRKTGAIRVSPTTIRLYTGMDGYSRYTDYILFSEEEYKYWERIINTRPEVYGGRVKMGGI